MAEPEPGAVVELLDRYLTSEAGRLREWAYRPAAPQLEVMMPVDHWRFYFKETGVADEVLAGVEAAMAAAEQRGNLVDRVALAELSANAGRTPDATVAAWVTVMCWGAGPNNVWRLRQWHRSMARPTLAGDLGRVIDLIEGNHLAEAYVAAALPGCSRSFFTKWLWMLGLSTDRHLSTQPLVHDERVEKVRRLLGWHPPGRNQAERWVEYCRTLAIWAEALNSRHSGWAVDSERLEQVMFDRSEAGSPSLYTWLSSPS